MPTLISTIDNFGPPVYYGDKFKQIIEDYLPTILTLTTNQTRQLGNDDFAKLYRYVGDFYGFLKAMGEDYKYHWAILRVNGFRSRFDLDLSLTSYIVPDHTFIDKLAQFCKEKN